MIVAVSAGRSVPREVRERLTPDAERVRSMLTRAHDGIGELLALATCHRVELYATTEGDDEEAAIDRLVALLDARADRAELQAITGRVAIRHLFRVTAGLDSLVAGEPQIQAQVRRALYESRRHDAIGPTLTTLVQHALRAGRRARRETSLGAIGESLGTATARLLEERLGRLDATSGVIVGAGEAAEDAAIAVRARGASLRIVSRNDAHAHALAARLDAETGRLDELDKLLLDASFAIVAVAGGEIVRARAGSDAILIDLSMPHGIAPGLGAITVDELPPPQGVAVSTGIAEATALVDDEVDALVRWSEHRHESGAAIRALRRFADAIVADEVARVAIDDADAARLASLADRVTAKLLHAPIAALRNADAKMAAWLADVLGARTLDALDDAPRREQTRDGDDA